MITDADIKKMKVVFAIKEDLKQLSDKFEAKFVTKEDLKVALEKYATKDDIQLNTKYIVEAMTEMTDSLIERINKVLYRTETNEDELQDHENRLRKVEDKVFAI
jgi:hypothetical protein